MVKEEIDDSLLTSGWETIKGELMNHPGVKDIHIDSSQLPLTTNSDGNQQFKTRKITKKYAFGKPEVPMESDYLEICYSAVALKPEYVIPVSGLAVPPLVVMTVRVQTTLKPKTSENEICMISCLIHHEFPINKAAPQPPFQTHFCAMTHPSDVPWPWDLKDALEHNQMKIEKSQSERALLCFFLAKMHKIDPDVVVGHDILGFDLPVLLDRIKKENIPHWSRLGRLRRTHKLKTTGKGYEEKTAMCGRLLCDVKISAKELIQAKSYELAPLINKVLRVPEAQLKTLTKKEVKDMYE
ncbi:DNA polymerase alpha catalytic subunit [Portunus trituberculatus]|uniref:DNA polymerase alpha catalytic subunit n=1 Tax=Portunus trituberculatus TaxID=210409 RepID=A0A5B7F9P4_PORTR|nr:DNA polymerase alpha catalytic subunit [Portunus trituberculatus]